jgi:hypothetical protein
MRGGGEFAAEETAAEGEILLPERVGIGGQDRAGEGSSVHGVNPVERQG